MNRMFRILLAILVVLAVAIAPAPDEQQGE